MFPSKALRFACIALALTGLAGLIPLAPSAGAAPPERVEPERADALERAGRERLQAGDYPAAVARLRQAVALRERLGDRGKEASTRNELCLAQQRGGRFAEARECYETTLAVVRALGDERGDALRALEATVLNNLGGIASNLGRPDEHRRYLLQALDLYRAHGDAHGEAIARNNLGAFHRGIGEVEEALGQYERALALFDGLDDATWRARTRNNLGYAYLSLGETEQAREWFREALPLRRTAGDHAGETVTLLNLGRSHAADGDLGQATAFARRALDAALAGRNPRAVATARRLLGSLHLERGETEAAREELTVALRSARAMGQPGPEAEALELLARVELAGEEGGRPELGREERERVVERARTAAAHARRAADLHHASGDPVGEVRARTTLARAERRRGHPERARREIDAALVILDAVWDGLTDPLRRASFLDTQRAAHEESVSLWMDRHRAEPDAGHDRAALAAAEAARARSLSALASRDGVREVPELLHADAIRALLGNEKMETVLVEFFLASEASFAWGVTRERVIVVELPSRDEIERAAEDVHRRLEAIHRRAPEDLRRLDELGRTLLGPLADTLGKEGEGPARLVVVADGALHFLPFAALPDPATGRALVERFEVVHAPSASVAATRRGRSPRAEDGPVIAVWADPVFTRDDPRLTPASPSPVGEERAVPPGAVETLRRLPWSRREAEAVAGLLPPERRRLALGTDARRSRVLDGGAAGARVLHFATHALADPRRPERSGLVLSRFDEAGRPLNGFLGFRDVAGLDLAAELVVLSGCRTALGRSLAGEGLVGLTHAFRLAGVPRVVASLWPVRDEATAELMERFYRALLGSPEMLPAAALRAAQLDLRREPRFRDPYYWAAFTLQGDWR